MNQSVAGNGCHPHVQVNLAFACDYQIIPYGEILTRQLLKLSPSLTH